VRSDPLDLQPQSLHRGASACKNAFLRCIGRCLVVWLELPKNSLSRVRAWDGHVTSIYRRISLGNEYKKRKAGIRDKPDLRLPVNE